MRARPLRTPGLILLLVAAAACGGGSGGRADREPLPAAPPVPMEPAPLLELAVLGDTGGWEDRDADPAAAVAPLFMGVDLLVLNLEGVLSSTPPPPGTAPARGNGSVFWSTPALLSALRLAPQAVATLANNHVLDLGPEGLAATREHLYGEGWLTCGAGADLDAAREPARLTLNGVATGVLARLAIDREEFLAGAARAGAAPWDPETTPAEISALRAEVDFLVVALHLHLGSSWTHRPDPEATAAVEAALDAGADLVVGHGPHFLQGAIVRAGGVGLSSLGNFVLPTDYSVREDARRTVVTRVAVHPDRLELRFLPVRTGPGGAAVAAGEEAGKILRRLHADFADQGTDLELYREEARLTVSRSR